MRDFSTRAGRALAQNNKKELILAYVNGTREIKKAHSTCIVYLKKEEHSKLCKDIAQEYTNLQGIYNVSRNPESVNTFDVEELNPNDDSNLEDLFGDQ